MKNTNIFPAKSIGNSKQNFSCVYAIKSIYTGDMYIGSTKHLGIRRRNHIHKLKNKTHHSSILQNHFNIYGIDDLFFIVLEKIKYEEALEKEQYYMDMHQPKFNVNKNAGSSIGMFASEETKKKLSTSHLGITPTKESLKKRSLSMKNKLSSLSKEEKIKRIAKANRTLWVKVVCIQTGVVYDSVAQAERETGCDNVTRICKTGRGSSKGLNFKYA